MINIAEKPVAHNLLHAYYYVICIFQAVISYVRLYMFKYRKQPIRL